MGNPVIFYCPRCWAEIPPDTAVCPYCRASIEDSTEEAFLDKLIDALRHPVPSQAALAAQILGQRRDPRGVAPLLDAFDRTRDPEIQEAVIRALGELGDPRAVALLSRVLAESDLFIMLRVAAAEALRNIGGEPAVQALREAAQGDDHSVSRAARAALTKLGFPISYS
jgi:HEAT repeat protein